MGRSRISYEEAMGTMDHGANRRAPGRPKNDRRYIKPIERRSPPADPLPDLSGLPGYFAERRTRPIDSSVPGKPTYPKATKRIVWHLYASDGEFLHSCADRQTLVDMQHEGDTIRCTIEAV